MSDSEIDLMKAKDDLIESMRKRIDGLVSYNKTLQQSVSQLTEHNRELRQMLQENQKQLEEALDLAEQSNQMVTEWRARYEAVTGTTGPLQ